jgi:hypothetical protein
MLTGPKEEEEEEALLLEIAVVYALGKKFEGWVSEFSTRSTFTCRATAERKRGVFY